MHGDAAREGGQAQQRGGVERRELVAAALLHTKGGDLRGGGGGVRVCGGGWDSMVEGSSKRIGGRGTRGDLGWEEASQRPALSDGWPAEREREKERGEPPTHLLEGPVAVARHDGRFGVGESITAPRFERRLASREREKEVNRPRTVSRVPSP